MGMPEIVVIVLIGLFLQYLVVRFATAAGFNDALDKRERERQNR